MKYFKFAQISQDTGISWAIAQPISGPSWPEIPGLDLNTSVQLSHNPIYYIAQVNDSAVANPDNHVFELSLAEYAEELKQHVMNQLNKEKDSIYTEDYSFRESIFSKYHDTASIAGVYKYQQAKELIEDNDAPAPEVRSEAAARDIDVLVLAARIIDNHESFRNKEAKVAGIRGKIWDRLQTFKFDLENPDVSYTEFLFREVVGTRTENVFEDGKMVEKEVDVTINKYTLALGTRFQYE
jgi:hypothetical protein